MIVIDYSGVAIAAITGFKEDLKRDEAHVENLIRHVILSTIKNYKKKFKREFGSEVVIAVDVGPYWRKRIFEHYKAGRKKAKDDSDIPWDLIFKHMYATLEDIKLHFPWKVIAVKGAEADDVMAIMANTVAYNNQTKDLLDTGNDPEKTVIVSSDKDLCQLMTHPNIRVWSPYKESFTKLEQSPAMFLRRLILTGDRGDGIPNCFSPSDSFVTGIRQKAATEKKMLPILEAKNMLDAAPDQTVRQRIAENARLISFAFIPNDLKQAIIEAYQVKPKGNQMTILKYLASKNMKQMLDDVDQF